MHSLHLGPSAHRTRTTETDPSCEDPPAARVVFFDAEGTLWVARPGRTMKEFWRDPTLEHARQVFETTAGIHEVLKRLRETGCRLVVLSRHDERLLPGILEQFRLCELFDDVLVNGDKGERAVQWLHKNGIPKEAALMVGDREDLDIAPMRRVGIRAVIVDRPYNRHVQAPRVHAIEDLVLWV